MCAALLLLGRTNGPKLHHLSAYGIAWRPSYAWMFSALPHLHAVIVSITYIAGRVSDDANAVHC